jgi:hypothetical protein
MKAKKSNDAAAVLRKGLQPKARPTTEAQEVKGAAAKAIAQQLTSDGIAGTNSSPKARKTNYWGVSEPGNKK